MNRREFLRLAACCGGVTALDWKGIGNILHAQEMFPSKKIVWISNSQPGGAFDIFPRAMSPFLTKYIKQLAPGCAGGDFMIKNDPAGGGRRAYKTLFEVKPDGYTIGGMDISFITDLATGNIEFDLTKYTYLAKLLSTTKIIVTGKNGLKSWQEAMEISKKAPLKIGVPKFGGNNHVAGILLKEALGLNAKFICSQGTPDTMAMVIRGDVHVGLASEDSISDLVQTKEVRVILTYKDTDEYPGAVTLKALGHPELDAYSSGHRFAIAPPGLPKEIASLYIEAFKRNIADKEFQEWAKRRKFHFTPLYGDSALELVNRYIQYFKNMEGTLKKYLL